MLKLEFPLLRIELHGHTLLCNGSYAANNPQSGRTVLRTCVEDQRAREFD